MKTVRIKDYVVSPSGKYFFDTNVWLFINGPMAGSNQFKQKKYSSLLSDILSRGAGLYVTSMVVSEYINSVLRIGFRTWINEDRANRINSDFKRDYRPTDHYADTLKDAVLQVNDILGFASKRPDDFHRLDMADLLQRLDMNCDYNDAYIVKCCEQDNLTLVSDDKDLQNVDSEIKLLTI